MSALPSVAEHLVDMAVILALGTVYIVALSVGTVYKAGIDLWRSIRTAVDETRVAGDGDGPTLTTGRHEAARETEK